ncbi:protein ROOT INITIATION DEFECTIVE 3-like [Gastrolobium bilobum]|uniref:protein ROOT INITIATION DEFECTIVE 3-like n=1 Tax=Gastrolobium bilobum TaxID=150636 RepID=UPI002AAFB786|nr:protein ROOT INITIATION DEFECTIVE 3-like [Gastrolobium bilobum]
MVIEGEALVACSDKSMKIGVTIWDMDTGENLHHIPTCASQSFGLVCLRNRFLVASQINKHGSVGGGAIVVWALNKPQQPLSNYTLEAFGPLSCTKDGIYLVAGALSGNAYIWDVTSGKLLKTWSAHNKSLNCMIFSDDNSLLISASDDGMICVWSMISLLDVEERGSLPSLLHCFSGHMSSITGLLTTPSSYSVLVSSSLDGTCKVWDFISGRLMQTQVYPLAITSIALHQVEMLLFYGTVNGTIIVNKLDLGLEEGPSIITIGQPLELKGHNGAITALTTSQAGLISASEDCTICIWDVINCAIIRRLSLQKGKVTNIVVVPRSSVLHTSNNRRISNEYNVSPLEKYSQSINSSNGTNTLLSLCRLYKEKQTCIDLRSSGFLRQNMSCSQKAEMAMAMAMQMKVETNIESRVWAIKMAKHVMNINKQLKSQLLDMMRRRLFSKKKNRISKK